MNDELKRIADALEQQANQFPWETVIASIALIASLITLFLLMKERYERKRPYLQISFELVRSTLACIVMRNTGKVPLVIDSIKVDREFADQLPENSQKKLIKKRNTEITVFPNRLWVLSLDVNVFDVMKYRKKTMDIDYTYHQLKHNNGFIESVSIDFDEYSGMLVYISELDEFKNSVNELKKEMKNIGMVIGNLDPHPIPIELRSEEDKEITDTKAL